MSETLKRAAYAIGGLFFGWMWLAATLYLFTDGIHWAVRNGAMAGSAVIIAGCLTYMCAVVCVFFIAFVILGEKS